MAKSCANTCKKPIEEDACVSPILTQLEMSHDPQVLAREMIVGVEDEKLGTSRTIGVPVKFSLTPGSIRTSAPSLGEHTDEVLSMLGCGAGEIAKLKELGVTK